MMKRIGLPGYVCASARSGAVSKTTSAYRRRTIMTYDKSMRCIGIIAFVCALAANAADSPAGVWRIDDAKGKPDALVLIFDKDGAYFGRFEKIFDPDPAGDRCTACRDERKDQPLVGMIFLSDLKPDGA